MLLTIVNYSNILFFMSEKQTKEKVILGIGSAIGGIALGSILASNLYKKNNIDGSILKNFTKLETLLKKNPGKSNPQRISYLHKKNIISKEEQNDLLKIVKYRNIIAHESKDIDEAEKNKTLRMIDRYIEKLSYY